MSEMGKGVFTLHKMLRGCVAGDDDAWLGFLRHYLPLAVHLAGHYFGDVAIEPESLAGQVFARAREQDAAALKAFSGTTEEEFLLHFRSLVMTEGRSLAEKPGAASDAGPRCTLELLEQAIAPLLYVQRQYLFLGLKGYAAAAIGEIMKVQPTAAAAALEKARAALGAQLSGDAEAYLTRQDALLREIEQKRTEDCLPARTYERICGGQITWRDKEGAERHILSCYHCLDSFANFYELKHYFRVLPLAEDSQLARVAPRLGLAPETRTLSPFARLMASLRGSRSSS